MTSDRVDKLVVQPAAASAVDKPRRRLTMMLGAATVLLAAVALGLFLVDRGQQYDRAEELERSVSALAQQVTQLGGTPVVQPSGVPGPQGPAGRDGRDGAAGMSPPCLAEQSRCRGEPGVPGVNGVDGKDGRDGTDGVGGQPPAGWSWIDGDGREQTCTRDPGSSDVAPRYTCTAPSAGPPGTAVSNPPLLRVGG